MGGGGGMHTLCHFVKSAGPKMVQSWALSPKQLDDHTLMRALRAIVVKTTDSTICQGDRKYTLSDHPS